MADVISIKCPACGTTLKSANPRAVDRQIACPNCSHLFVVESAHAASLAGPGDAPADILEEFEQSPPAVSAAPAGLGPIGRAAHAAHAARAERPPGPAGPKWVKPAFIVVGGAIAALVIAGIAWVGVTMFATSDKHEAFAWLPPDAELIAVLRVSELCDSPFLKEFVDDPEFERRLSRDEWWRKTGLDSIRDVESVTFGLTGVAELKSVGPAGPVGRVDGVGVIRTNRRLDIDRIAADMQPAEHRSQRYYLDRPRGTRRGEPLAVFFPDAQTCVLGPEASIQAAIVRGPRSAERDDLDFVDFDQHVVLAWVPKNGKLVPDQARGMAATSPAMLKELVTTLENEGKAAALGLTFNESIDVRLQGVCISGEAADDVRKHLEDLLTTGKGALKVAKGTLPPDWVGPLGEIVSSTHVVQKDAIVTVHTSVPASLKSVFRTFSRGSLPGLGPRKPPSRNPQVIP